MQIVNGAGHCPHQDYPQVVNKHIREVIVIENSNLMEFLKRDIFVSIITFEIK